MRFRISLLAAIAFLVPNTAWPQPTPVKVLIIADMEGISGATEAKYVRFSMPDDYARGRESLTADVNAAIAGLKAAGATEIVVADGHSSGNRHGPDVLEDRLSQPATVYYQDTPFDIYMDSYDSSFDAIVAVGMHAAAGNRAGFLSHTYTSRLAQYKVNGVPFNESMILAMGAARMKIPVIMVAGDDQLGKEIRRHMPWAAYAAVKRALNRAAAESFPPEEVKRRIETAARLGLENLRQAKMPVFPGPYRFALTFHSEEDARRAALLQGAELQPDGLTVQVRASDFEEGYRKSLLLIDLGRSPSGSAPEDSAGRKYWGPQ